MTRYEFDQQIEMTYNERLLLDPMFEVLKSPKLFEQYQRRLENVQSWKKLQLIDLLTIQETTDDTH